MCLCKHMRVCDSERMRLMLWVCVGWSCHTEPESVWLLDYMWNSAVWQRPRCFTASLISPMWKPLLFTAHSATHHFINHFITYHQVLSISSKQGLFLELDVTVYLPSENPVDKRWKMTPSQSVLLASAIKWFSVTCGQEFSVRFT